jgi:hypothetical protein
MDSTQKRRTGWVRKAGFVATVASGVTLLGTAVGGIASVDQELRVAALKSGAIKQSEHPSGADWNDGGKPISPRRSARKRPGDCPFRREKKELSF